MFMLKSVCIQAHAENLRCLKSLPDNLYPVKRCLTRELAFELHYPSVVLRKNVKREIRNPVLSSVDFGNCIMCMTSLGCASVCSRTEECVRMAWLASPCQRSSMVAEMSHLATSLLKVAGSAGRVWSVWWVGKVTGEME